MLYCTDAIQWMTNCQLKIQNYDDSVECLKQCKMLYNYSLRIRWASIACLNLLNVNVEGFMRHVHKFTNCVHEFKSNNSAY